MDICDDLWGCVGRGFGGGGGRWRNGDGDVGVSHQGGDLVGLSREGGGGSGIVGGARGGGAKFLGWAVRGPGEGGWDRFGDWFGHFEWPGKEFSNARVLLNFDGYGYECLDGARS